MVPSPAGCTINRASGKSPHHRARPSGVIEMDMRQDDVNHIFNRNPEFLKRSEGVGD